MSHTRDCLSLEMSERMSHIEKARLLIFKHSILCTPDVTASSLNFTDDETSQLAQIIEEEGIEYAAGVLKHATVERSPHIFYPERGQTIAISQHDLLVTTPVAAAKAHEAEAADLIGWYQEEEQVGYYYRLYNSFSPPKQLRIGSRMFYVDRRAIRGFATVTNFRITEPSNYLEAHMNANTWRWIQQIACDYDKLKPPQGYAYASRHPYLQGVSSVNVIGDWLDPIPK